MGATVVGVGVRVGLGVGVGGGVGVGAGATGSGLHETKKITNRQNANLLLMILLLLEISGQNSLQEVSWYETGWPDSKAILERPNLLLPKLLPAKPNFSKSYLGLRPVWGKEGWGGVRRGKPSILSTPTNSIP